MLTGKLLHDSHDHQKSLKVIDTQRTIVTLITHRDLSQETEIIPSKGKMNVNRVCDSLTLLTAGGCKPVCGWDFRLDK